MPRTRHEVALPTVAPGSDELGRVGWLLLGFAALATAAIGHALAGLFAIAKDMLRSAPRAPSSEPVPAAALSVNEKDGWILIGTLVVLVGAMGRTATVLAEGIKKIIHTARRRVLT